MAVVEMGAGVDYWADQSQLERQHTQRLQSLRSEQQVHDPNSSPTPQKTRRQRPTAIRCSRPACDAVIGPTQLNREYELMEPLGKGSAAVVRRAVRRCDGSEFSIKIVRTDEPEIIELTRKEVAILKTLQHPHIIKGYDFIACPTRVAIVLEFFPGTTLKEAVQQSEARRLSERAARVIFGNLIGAIAYLHREEIVHRDVKAENVLVSNDLGDLRLIDFNTAQRIEDGALSMTGTREWSAPEVLCGESPDMPQDVWGAGLCLYLMIFGGLPQKVHRYHSQEAYAAGTLRAVASALAGNTSDANPTELCREAMKGCLEEDPGARQVAEAVLSAAWLQ